MATPMTIRYPLDPSGTNPNNLVSGEIQNLTPNRTVRAIATDYGAFFTESLIVTDMANNAVLTPNTQYYAAELYELPSARYGKEICAVILITDPTVSNQVSLQYQCLGGPYSTSATAIIQQIENLGLDDRPVAWGDILGRPSAFPPAFHLHDIGDVYGFEYLVHAIDRVRDAILVGDSSQYDQIYAYIDNVANGLQAQITANLNAIDAHLADFTNPHRVTAAQVGAYTTQQSDAITTPISTLLNNHVANLSNPHQVTAAQVGAYSTAQSDSQLASAVSNLQTQINGKQPNGNYAVLLSDVEFNNGQFDGTITCAHDIWAFYSDQRLKTDIREIKNAREKLRKVRAVLYRHNVLAENLIQADMDRDFMGLLAQEVQAVCPEIVGLAVFDRVYREDGSEVVGLSRTGNNYLTIQYEKFCVLLLAGFKELDAEVQEHSRKLDLLVGDDK